MTGGSLDTFSSVAIQQPERKSTLLSTYSAQRLKPVVSRHFKPGPDFGKTRLKYEGQDDFGSGKSTTVFYIL